MYSKIVVALGLEHGPGYKAMEVARQLLSKGGEITAIHVIEPLPGVVACYLPEGHEAEIKANAWEEMRKRIGSNEDTEAKVLIGHPGRLIPDYAADIDADCIVIGSHKSELGDYLLGSTAARVVRHAKCPVHVLR
jgi:nucleotide-binding universal stress UspA family protein